MAAVRGTHFMAVGTQQDLEGVRGILIVIGHQNLATDRGALHTLGSTHIGLWRSLAAADGEGHHELAAPARTFTERFDRAAVKLDESLDE